MTDDLDTIDGVLPRETTVEATPTPRPSPFPSTSDYSELMPVERRHYSITGEIAKGGMGRVLDARDLRLGRAVAIKELLPKNRDLVRRFEREARITARLQHPAIIHVYEAGVWVGGEPFYAMAKVAGRSLDKVIAEKATLNERLGLLPNVIAVAEALAYAHDAGVIHRDLKPANVLVGEFGQTVVIDWGLAKDLGSPEESSKSMRFEVSVGDTSAGSVVGTPAYMPPEQARGLSVDQRADVYALGALLYTVLVGKPPYVGCSHKEVLDRVRNEEPTPIRTLEPGAPLDLAAIVAKAMDRDPEWRYADAGELVQDLRRFETGQLVAAHHYTTSQLAWRWLRRHRLAIGIASAAVIALTIVGGYSISRIVDDKRSLASSRSTLLEDRGRNELQLGHFGKALVYFDAAARDHDVDGTPLGFMIAEAVRPFDAEVASILTGGTTVVAYSPDGKTVAAAGIGGLRLRDAGGGVRTFNDNVHGATRTIAFDQRGQRIVTAGDDKFVRVWSLDGKVLRRLAGHTEPVYDAVFSNDGRYIAVASADGQTRVWEDGNDTPQELYDDPKGKLWSCSGGPVVSVRFSADDAYIATASGDAACVWERVGKKAWAVASPLRGHQGAVRTVRWSVDGYIATASDDGTARVWELPKPSDQGFLGAGKPVIAPIGREHGPAVASAEWSPDGKRLLVADRAARVWRLPERRHTSDAKVSDLNARAIDDVKLEGHSAAVSGAVFSRDGSLVATASRDDTVRVWSAATGYVILTLELASAVETLAFAPDGQHLVTGGRDGTARIWDLSKRVEVRRHAFDSPVHGVAVAADGTVAVGRDDSNVTLLHGDEEVSLENGHVARVLAVAWSPDGSQLVTAGDEEDARLWASANLRQRPRRLGHGSRVRSVAFGDDGRTIATAGDDGVIRLWNATNAEAAGTLESSAMLLTSVAFGPNRLLAALDQDGALLLWDRNSHFPPARRKLTEAAHAFAFSRDGGRIVLSTATETVIYEVVQNRIGAELLKLEPADKAHTVAFSADGLRVLTAGGDGLVRIWDAAKGNLIWTRDAQGAAVEALALSPDGNTLWAAGTANDTGIVRAWNIRANVTAAERIRALGSDPYELGEDDVVKLKTRGPGNDQR